MPKLASKWEIRDDGRTIRLELDPKVRFHDSSQLTADIVRDALRGPLNDAATRRSAISYASVTSLETDGPHTLVVRLAQPEAFFLTDLAYSAIGHPQNSALGTGPFKRPASGAEQRDSEDFIRLEVFDNYYRGRPGVDAVEFRRFEEQRSAWAALLRSEIDAVHEMTPGSLDFTQEDRSIATFELIRPYFMLLGLNVKHPVLGKKAVRQALSQAIDREELINLALNKQGIVADSPIWPFHWAYSSAQRFSHNPEAASLRLDAAGLKMNAKREPGQMPSRFRFTCLTVPDSRYEKLAVILQKQLYDIGVDMQIVVMPVPELGARVASGNYDAFLAERTSGRSLNWTYATFHSAFRMFPGYTAADSALERLRSARTDNDTRAAVVDLQRVLHDDPPALFLAWPRIARAVSTRFEVPEDRGRDVISSLWQWRLAATRP